MTDTVATMSVKITVYRMGQKVILLTAFSHRIFKHKTIVKQNTSCENIRQCFIFSVAARICSRSFCLLNFIDIFAYNQQITF